METSERDLPTTEVGRHITTAESNQSDMNLKAKIVPLRIQNPMSSPMSQKPNLTRHLQRGASPRMGATRSSSPGKGKLPQFEEDGDTSRLLHVELGASSLEGGSDVNCN